MFKRTLKTLRGIAGAGGCARHDWTEYRDDARSVSCRYQLTCKHCAATVTLYVDGYGKVGAVHSPHANAHHYADPEAQYHANRRALHASARAEDAAQIAERMDWSAANTAEAEARRQAKAAISWRVKPAPATRSKGHRSAA